jgi:hypothetical protein
MSLLIALHHAIARNEATSAKDNQGPLYRLELTAACLVTMGFITLLLG